MNTVSGLLKQKGTSPAPQPGEVRRFTVTEMTGQSGTKYNKVKREGEGYGQPYEIVSVRKTDRTDQHGNVSFNITLRQVAESGGSANSNGSNGAHETSSDRSSRIERQHSQDMAIAYLRLLQSAGKLPEDTKTAFLALVDWFQRDIGKSPVAKKAEPEPEVEQFPTEPDGGLDL